MRELDNNLRSPLFLSRSQLPSCHDQYGPVLYPRFSSMAMLVQISTGISDRPQTTSLPCSIPCHLMSPPASEPNLIALPHKLDYNIKIQLASKAKIPSQCAAQQSSSHTESEDSSQPLHMPINLNRTIHGRPPVPAPSFRLPGAGFPILRASVSYAGTLGCGVYCNSSLSSSTCIRREFR